LKKIDKSINDTFYDDLNIKQLSEKLHNAIDEFYTEEKFGGTLTMPISYSKVIQDKISKVAKIENYLYFKIQKEDERNKQY